MLANIPPPPAPPVLYLYVAAGICILLGVALLLWGRSSGRVLLTLAAAGAGAACAPSIGRIASFPYPWVVGMAAATTAGVIVFLLARLVWALLLSLLVGVVALTIIQWPGVGTFASLPDWTSSNFATFGDWAVAVGQYYVLWGETLWQQNMLPLLLMVALPMVAAIVAGLGGALWSIKPNWLGMILSQAKVIAAVGGVLALAGLLIQSRSECKAIAKAKAKENEKQASKKDAPPGAPPKNEGKQAKS